MADDRLDEEVAVLDLVEIGTEVDERTPDKPHACVAGVVLGRLVALPAPDQAVVALRDRESAATVRVRRLAGLTEEDIGRQVALMFEAGDPERPVIIGRVEAAPAPVAEAAAADAKRATNEPVTLNAETIVLTGEKEIVLRCGKASITLTRAGKVLIRGAYLLSRSSGVNRIKGGSVQIN